MKIVMTAFEIFGSFNKNSSFIALNKIDNPLVYKLVLPVSYPDAFDKLKKELTFKPDIFILLGMAANRNVVTIEEKAINELNFSIPDNNNLTIKEKLICNEGNKYIYSKVNIDELITYLNDLNFECEKSTDAGKYICNYLYYEVLNNYNVPAIFVHIPMYETIDQYNELDKLLNSIIIYFKNKKDFI